MIKDVMLKKAVNQLTRLIDIEIDRAREDDRDEDYDMLVDSHYRLEEICMRLLEVLKK